MGLLLLTQTVELTDKTYISPDYLPMFSFLLPCRITPVLVETNSSLGFTPFIIMCTYITLFLIYFLGW